MVLKRLMSLLPHKEAVRIDLEPFKEETKPLAKLWCVKMENVAHQFDKLNNNLRAMKTYSMARYRLSD